MAIAQKYCEKCGLDYHGVLAMNCKSDSPNIGTPAWRNGRAQVMSNIYARQHELRKYIVERGGEDGLRQAQEESRRILNEATYGQMQDYADAPWQ